MKAYGELMEQEEVVFHSNVADERDELARRFVIRASAREILERHVTRCSFGMTKADPTALPLHAPRRTQASTSTSSRIVLKFCACGWSEDAWDSAPAYILMSSIETTNKRFEVEVPSTAVIDMSGVSAGTSVPTVVVVPADNSPADTARRGIVDEQRANDECVIGQPQFDVR